VKNHVRAPNLGAANGGDEARFSRIGWMSVSTSKPQPKIHLLTEEDLFCITHQGAPMELRPELVHVTGNGEIIFTIRGIQFYRHALQQHALDVKLNTIQTQTDLLHLHVDLGAAAFSHVVALMDSDSSVSDHEREKVQALIKCTLEAIAHSANKLRGHLDPSSTLA
jgi:hypothetical protein